MDGQIILQRKFQYIVCFSVRYDPGAEVYPDSFSRFCDRFPAASRVPPESNLAYRPMSSSTRKVQANNEDGLPPDTIDVSISASHLRGDVRMDARKR